MSDATDHDEGPPQDDPDLRAAEYALHLLSNDERRDFEDDLAVDGGLRLALVRWEERLAAIALAMPDIAPPPRLRAALALSTAEDVRPRDAERRSRWSFGRFLGGAFGGLVAAAAGIALLAVILPRVEPPYSGPFFTAELTADGSPFVLNARFDPRDNRLTIERQAGEPPAGRVLELWLIAEGRDAPVSLGLLSEAGAETVVNVSQELAAELDGGTLAVSDEPPGGSPTGAPTGEVRAAGPVSET